MSAEGMPIHWDTLDALRALELHHQTAYTAACRAYGGKGVEVESTYLTYRRAMLVRQELEKQIENT